MSDGDRYPRYKAINCLHGKCGVLNYISDYKNGRKGMEGTVFIVIGTCLAPGKDLEFQG